MNETQDASVRVIGLTAAIVAGGIAASLGLAWLLWSAHPAVRRPLSAERFAHGPADAPDILREWPAIQAETRKNLATYGWVDRPAGVVRIPIDQAMQRLAGPR